MALVPTFHAMAHRFPGGRVRHGMTTTEMLVTMGILALLVGITLPVISGVKRSQARAQCAANLHSIGIAFTL